VDEQGNNRRVVVASLSRHLEDGVGVRERRGREQRREVGLGRTWRKKEILLRSTSYAMNGVHSSGVKTVQMSCHQPMYMSKPKEATLATDQLATIACLFTPLYVMKSVSGVR